MKFAIATALAVFFAVSSFAQTARFEAPSGPISNVPEPPEAQTIEAPGGFKAAYPEVKNPRFEALRSGFMKGRVLERWAADLNESLVVPQALTLQLAECGVTNAFYNPQDHSVTLCYELVQDFQKIFADLSKKPKGLSRSKTVDKATGGALSFVLFHELGHALIDVLDIPATGKEEDAADQLATVVLLQASPNGEKAALSAAVALSDMGAKIDESEFADVHSLGPQRFYNITCWVYGENPEKHAELIEGGSLPKERAEGCADEYAKMARAWTTLLGPHLRRSS